MIVFSKKKKKKKIKQLFNHSLTVYRHESCGKKKLLKTIR